MNNIIQNEIENSSSLLRFILDRFSYPSPDRFIIILKLSLQRETFPVEIIDYFITHFHSYFEHQPLSSELLECAWNIQSKINSPQFNFFLLDFYFRSDDSIFFQEFVGRCLAKQQPDLLLLMSKCYRQWRGNITSTILIQYHDINSGEIENVNFPVETNRIALYLFVSSQLENDLSISSFSLALDNKELSDDLISLSSSSIISF
jgi:hypothetical protein